MNLLISPGYTKPGLQRWARRAGPRPPRPRWPRSPPRQLEEGRQGPAAAGHHDGRDEGLEVRERRAQAADEVGARPARGGLRRAGREGGEGGGVEELEEEAGGRVQDLEHLAAGQELARAVVDPAARGEADELGAEGCFLRWTAQWGGEGRRAAKGGRTDGWQARRMKDDR